MQPSSRLLVRQPLSWVRQFRAWLAAVRKPAAEASPLGSPKQQADALQGFEVGVEEGDGEVAVLEHHIFAGGGEAG